MRRRHSVVATASCLILLYVLWAASVGELIALLKRRASFLLEHVEVVVDVMFSVQLVAGNGDAWLNLGRQSQPVAHLTCSGCGASARR